MPHPRRLPIVSFVAPRARRSSATFVAFALAAVAVIGCDDGTASQDEDAVADAVDAVETAEMGVDTATAIDSTVAVDMAPDASVCGDDVCAADEEGVCAEDCAAGPVFAWDPTGDDLTAFPDDFQTVADPMSATGLRVDVNPTALPALERFPEPLRPVFEQMSALDGFSPTAAIYMGFDAPIDRATWPADEAATLSPDSALVVGYVDDDEGFVQVPVRLDSTGYRLGVLMRVAEPLPPGTLVAAVVKDSVTGDDGNPAQANAVLRALLAGTAGPEFEAVQEKYTRAADALEAAGAASRDEIAGMTVFTTQTVHAATRGLAERVLAEEWGIQERLGCEQGNGNYDVCQFTFEAPDIRDAAGHVDFSLQSPLPRYTMQGVAYVPRGMTPQGGFPAIVFGHGLGGDRFQAGRATALVERDWVMVSLDAPGHGDHPRYEPAEQVEQVLGFFGVSLDGEIGMNPLVMQGSFIQGSMDKLALERALGIGAQGQPGPGANLDGVGGNEISGDDFSYVGVSLGGIMASQYLALSPGIEAAVVISGAGRTTDVVADSTLGPTLDFILPAGLTAVDGSMLFTYVQTVVDAGDGGNWARHVTRDRFDGRPGIHLLNAIAMEDEVVPNSTSYFLARAFGGRHVEPELLPVVGLDLVAPPLRANGPDGNTVAFMQFDWINDAGTEQGWEPADHQNIAPSTVGLETWGYFLDSFRIDGSAEVRDPYAALGLTPPR